MKTLIVTFKNRTFEIIEVSGTLMASLMEAISHLSNVESITITK